MKQHIGTCECGRTVVIREDDSRDALPKAVVDAVRHCMSVANGPTVDRIDAMHALRQVIEVHARDPFSESRKKVNEAWGKVVEAAEELGLSVEPTFFKDDAKGGG